jgi:tetratricopeptide (TPR) repeat protein
MYLKGSQWSMNRRRKPLNYFNVALLVLLIGVGLYLNYYIVPEVELPGIPTATPTRSPESYLTEAEQLFQQGKLAQAVDAYQQAVKTDPTNASAYISMARTQVWVGQYADAQVSAENALLLNQNNPAAHAVRGWALSAQGDYLTAETAIKRALELDPNNALAHAYYAELLTDQYYNNLGGLDIIDRMSEESRIALSLGENTVEAHRARGYVLEATGNSEEAIREYAAAVAINTNIPDLHLSLGRNYRTLGVYDKAVESLTRANSLNPADPTPDLIISRIYATLGEFAKGEQYAEQAVKDSPTDANLYGNLGVMYYRNFKWEEAETALAYVVNGGQTEEGAEILPIALDAGSFRVPEYYFSYGLVLVRLNRCGEALPIFQQILSAVPGDEISVYNANEGIRMCAEALGTPLAPTETPEPSPTP